MATVPVITIDGPSGSGKGTVSRALAERLGWHWLDSGALYRLVALAAQHEGLDPERAADVERAAELSRALPVEFVPAAGDEPVVRLAGEDVTLALRTEACGEMASRLAGHPGVRQGLLQLQRDFRRAPGLVADGRDMGTVVFPDAPLKIFLVASAHERARRRHEQLLALGINANLSRIYAEIVERDRRDAARKHAPLIAATDAHTLDTTDLDPKTVVERVFQQAAEAGLAG